jgi:hypothetical protein
MYTIQLTEDCSLRFFRVWFITSRQRSHKGFNTEEAVVNVLMTVMLSTVEGGLSSVDAAYDGGAFIHMIKKHLQQLLIQ